MQLFEYYSVYIGNSDQPGATHVEELNRQGAAGWELVQIVSERQSEKADSIVYYRAYFKRPL